jgi:MoaA/NifB/PqqE/SkfB family radical SAM enzyme
MKNIVVKGAKEIVNTLRFIGQLTKREVKYYKITPSESLFFITYRCSSRCKVCSMWKRKKDYEEMDLAGWKRAVDMVAEMGIGKIYLFGGDVLLKKEITIPLATYISEKGICCDITTNGNLLNQENAKKLMATGAMNVGISIDAVGDLHDQIRGIKGMFKRATQGIRYMNEARGDAKEPSISIYCTISKLNIDAFDKVLPLALDLGVDELHFEPYGEFTKEYAHSSIVDGITANPYFLRQDDTSLLLDENQALYLKNKVIELKEKAWGKIETDTDNIERVSVEELATGKYDSKRCYMARYHIAIDPSGNVLPCLFFQDYNIGNVQNTHLKNIWGNKRHKKFLASIKRQELRICQQCVVGVQRNRTAGQKFRRRMNDLGMRVKRKLLGKTSD